MELDEPQTSGYYASIARKVQSGELVLCDKPKRSKVWLIFSKILNRDGEAMDLVWCKGCEKVYRHSHSQTSNLCRHSCFVKKFTNAENENSPKEEEMPTPTSATGEIVVNKLTQLLTKLVIQNCCSYDEVESEGLKAIFLELLKLGAKYGSDIDPDNFLPSSTEVSATVAEVYNYVLESIKMELASVKENGFALAAYIWTDNLTNQNYITLNVHYWKNSGLIYNLLGFQLIESDFTTDENITETVKSILEKFDCQVTGKCTFVTSGAPYSIKTLPDSQNLPCISQLLSNALLKSIEKVPQVLAIINSCSKLANFLRKYAPNTLACKLSQKRHHNRCLAIYEKLNSVLINWNEIDHLIQAKNEKQNFTINTNELEAIAEVLQPFSEAIETLEDDTHATLHLVMAYMHELRKFCQTTITEYKQFDFVKKLQENMRSNLEQIMTNDITILHKVAVFLYPPTNKLLLYNDNEKQSIENECVRLLNYYNVDAKPLIKQESDEQQSLASVCKRRKLLADFLESEQTYDSMDFIKQEMQNYKNTRVVFSSDFNPFQWWELQKNNFPLLYKLSCTVLATPATGAAAKRVFSKAKRLVSETLRQDSSQTDIESIMFIRTNAPGVELDKYFTA